MCQDLRHFRTRSRARLRRISSNVSRLTRLKISFIKLGMILTMGTSMLKTTVNLSALSHDFLYFGGSSCECLVASYLSQHPQSHCLRSTNGGTKISVDFRCGNIYLATNPT